LEVFVRFTRILRWRSHSSNLEQRCISRRRRKHSCQSFRLAIEALEDRTAPSATNPFYDLTPLVSTGGDSINGQAVTATAPTLTVAAGPVSVSQSTVTLSAPLIPPGGTATVTLTARDSLGNQENAGGLTVAFALGNPAAGSLGTVQDNGDGTYTATFTAATTPASSTISATINGQAITSTTPTIAVTSLSLAQSTVTLAPAIIRAGGTATVTLTLRDASGNQVTDSGLTVAFALGIGGINAGTFGAVTDNGDGTYTATFTAGNFSVSDTITATINGQAVTAVPPTVAVQEQLSQLRAQYGFYFTGNYWQDYNGLNAKWFRARTGQQWYAIFNDGSLKRWNGIVNGVDSFTTIATLNPQVWVNPDLLLQARLILSQTDQTQLSQLRALYGFYFTGSYSQDYEGLNAKWFLDRTGMHWYALFSDGSLKQWNLFPFEHFTATITTVSVLAWDDPTLLLQAPLLLSAPDQTQLSQLRAQYGFYTTGSYSQSYNGLNAKWFLDNTGQQWYAIRTDGRLQQWNGLVDGVDKFTTVATVNALVWDDPNLLLQAPLKVSEFALTLLSALSQGNGFHFGGSYWLNYLNKNLNEKWFQDGQNNWYFITPQGDVSNDGVFISVGLDPEFWDDPTLMFNARLSTAGQAELSALQQQFGFYFTGDYSLSYNQLNARWFQDRQGFWYAIRTDGSLQRWNGLVNGVDTFTTIATVDKQVWTDPNLLFLA
jgi:hypothetical protein